MWTKKKKFRISVDRWILPLLNSVITKTIFSHSSCLFMFYLLYTMTFIFLIFCAELIHRHNTTTPLPTNRTRLSYFLFFPLLLDNWLLIKSEVRLFCHHRHKRHRKFLWHFHDFCFSPSLNWTNRDLGKNFFFSKGELNTFEDRMTLS